MASLHDSHLLMRLERVMNALSQFMKKLKKYIKENGISATLTHPFDMSFLDNYEV